MAKQSELRSVRQAYDALYKQCIIKYFTLSKTDSEERYFFGSLISICERLMARAKPLRFHSIENMREQTKDTKIVIKERMAFDEMQKFYHKEVVCPDNLLRRKNFFEIAYALGFGYNSWISNTDEKIYQKAETKLSLRDVFIFFQEITVELSKKNSYQELSDNLRPIFCKYHVPFITD